MEITLVFVSLSCLQVISSGFEYNFHITHGGSPADGYAGQGQSSVHFKGPQSTGAASGYKDEQAHAPGGYHGYDEAAQEQQGEYTSAAHHYSVGRPDDKYKYAVSNQIEDPQTELRYVSQEEAAKYHQELQHSIKYVPEEDAHKYQEGGDQSALARKEKYENYHQSEKYPLHEQVPLADAQQYRAYEPAPASQRYREYGSEPSKYKTVRPLSQVGKFVQYQPVEQQHEQQQHYRRDHDQHHSLSPYQDTEKFYAPPTPAVEQKLQYVQAEEQPQQHYGHHQAPLQYVQQYAPSHQRDGEQPTSENSANYHKQEQEYEQVPNYVYAYPSDSVQHTPRHHVPLQPQQQHNRQQLEQHEQQQQQQAHERAPPENLARQRKIELADQYKLSLAYGTDHLRGRSGVSQSAPVLHPSYKQPAVNADPRLTRIGAQGAPTYGLLAHSTHSIELAPGHAEIRRYTQYVSNTDALQPYRLPEQQYAPQNALSKATQHSFPNHLTHGIARGVRSSSATHLQDFNVEKSKRKSR